MPTVLFIHIWYFLNSNDLIIDFVNKNFERFFFDRRLTVTKWNGIFELFDRGIILIIE